MVTKPLSDEVRHLIEEWLATHDGHVYAPVLHPEFASAPANHGPERFDLIQPFLGHEGGTALDIGTHWGYIAHRLEDLGYKVTAVEYKEDLAKIAEGLRDAAGKTFQIINSSIFEVESLKYDVVIALNVFHHFLKKKPRYDAFLRFLKRMECKSMIFQAHRPEEPQMRDSYRNMGPHEFAGFIASQAGFKNVQHIGEYRRRQIFRLS